MEPKTDKMSNSLDKSTNSNTKNISKTARTSQETTPFYTTFNFN